MINNLKVIVVMPAYNAEKTLGQTIAEIPMNIVDDIVLVDDASTDQTYQLAHTFPITKIIRHDDNL